MNDHVHVDEKWFYLKEPKIKPLLAARERPRYRCTQNKRFVPKFTFLSAIAGPRFDDKGNALFDGMLDVWAFAEFQEARRSAKYRPRGTKELKPVNLKT